jgi:hypothetical protein
VALRIVAWIDGSWRRFSCHDDSDICRNNVPFIALGACQLLITANSMLKLPVLCLASRQYRDCLRRICCMSCTARPSSSRSVRVQDSGHHRGQQQQQQQQRHSKQARNDVRSSTGVALISSSSSEESNRFCIEDGRCERTTSRGVDNQDFN